MAPTDDVTAGMGGDDTMSVLEFDEDKTMIRQLQTRRPLHRATSLHKMAKQDPDDLDMENVTIDAKDEGGRTLLHHATMMEQTEMVKRLLSEGASPNMPNRPGRTALHLAVWTGRLKSAKPTTLSHQGT